MLRKLSIIVALLLASLGLTGFAGPASSMAEEEGNPWLLWIFVFVVLVAFVAFLAWWWRRGGDEEEKEIAPPARPEVAGPAAGEAAAEETVDEAAAAEEAVAKEPASPPPEPNDLKVIEGIGPKISSVLQAAGITTFAQLAESEPGQLEQILEEADPNLLRLTKPATWPEQANLAAEGRWEELEKLQDELHGGHRR